MSIATFLSSAESAAVQFLYPLVAPSSGGTAAFHCVMFSLNVVSLVWLVVYVPETAHRSVSELLSRWVEEETDPLLQRQQGQEDRVTLATL